MDLHKMTSKTDKQKTSAHSAEPSPKFSSIIEFVEGLSGHGVKYWLNWEKPFCSRVIWLWLFSLSCGYCLYLIQGHFVSYFRRDIQMSTKKLYWNETVFPAATICPYNTVRKSIVSGSTEMLTLIGQLLNVQYDPLRCFDPNNTHPLKAELNKGFSYFVVTRGGASKALPLIVEDSERNVILCEWLGQSANCSDMFVNILTDFGVCFTFNAGYQFAPEMMWPRETPLRRVSSAGAGNSLRLLLRTQPQEYCIPIGSSVGYTVFVHSPADFPLFLETEGYRISPGFSTKMKISTKQTQRFTEHLGKCISSGKHLPMIPRDDYDRDGCYLQCLSTAVIRNCLCIPQFTPPSAYQMAINMVDYLDKQNSAFRNKSAFMYLCPMTEERRMCLNQQLNIFSHANLKILCAKCLPACNETKYEVTASSSYYPSPIEYVSVKESLNLSDSMTESKFRQEFVDLLLYLDSNKVNVVVERVRITFNDFLANIGGALGLFVGMSLLSLAEFLHLAVIAVRRMGFHD